MRTFDYLKQIIQFGFIKIEELEVSTDYYQDKKFEASNAKNSKMKTIMIIDDSKESLALCKHYLKTIPNCAIFIFQDEIEAVESVERLNPDLVVIDFQLNDFDGLVISKALDDLCNREIPTLHISAHRTNIIPLEEHLGFRKKFLKKPITSDKLIEKSVHLLSKCA